MTAKFWDKRAQKYNDDIEKHDGVYMQTIESTKSLLSTSDVVLDLGCASGEFSLDIAPHVQRVHGIDTSTNMIAIATEKASDRSIDNVTFDPTDLFDRSLDAHGYTVVLAFNFLHLVEDVGTVLGRINRLLPTGGLLISQTPCLGERGLLFSKGKLWVPTLRLLNQRNGIPRTRFIGLSLGNGNVRADGFA
jgi:2-polyprenyl-3-methyl-5-hydroxy-6-metoxy-1,4-benzoquinol methylase